MKLTLFILCLLSKAATRVYISEEDLAKKLTNLTNTPFKVYKMIGKGVQGKVYSGKMGAQNCVVKMMNKTTFAKQEFESEANILSQLEKHSVEQRKSLLAPKVLFKGEIKDNLVIVMDLGIPFEEFYALKGNLKSNCSLLDLAESLNNLHAIGYIHADIKPENVVFQKSGKLMLIDYGASSKPGEVGGGSLMTASPEAANNILTNSFSETLDYRSDTFSLGITAYYLTHYDEYNKYKDELNEKNYVTQEDQSDLIRKVKEKLDLEKEGSLLKCFDKATEMEKEKRAELAQIIACLKKLSNRCEEARDEIKNTYNEFVKEEESQIAIDKSVLVDKKQTSRKELKDSHYVNESVIVNRIRFSKGNGDYNKKLLKKLNLDRKSNPKPLEESKVIGKGKDWREVLDHGNKPKPLEESKVIGKGKDWREVLDHGNKPKPLEESEVIGKGKDWREVLDHGNKPNKSNLKGN